MNIITMIYFFVAVFREIGLQCVCSFKVSIMLEYRAVEGCFRCGFRALVLENIPYIIILHLGDKKKSILSVNSLSCLDSIPPDKS
jgi:hypothetical protein